MMKMDTPLMPRDAARFIAKNSKDVTIPEEGVQKTAEKLFNLIRTGSVKMDVERWTTHELNPKSRDKAAVDWIFLSDVLNFSFWSEDECNKYTVKYNGTKWTGYWSMCACINRAIDEGIPFTDPKYYSSITKEQLKHVLRSDSDVEMPLFEERLRVLHEAGTVLMEKYDGSFVNVVNKAEKSAQKLVELTLKDFSSFKDEAELEGEKVALYKRVQILVADIWAGCGGRGLGEFTDIDSITMFADYRIPQALIWFGALEYSSELKELLDKGHMFNSGDRQEVEIRGCSIWSVELIVEAMRKLIKSDRDLDDSAYVNAILVDHFLWDYRREHAVDTSHIPIHKIRCIYY